jgi:Domain of unknown function (DUF222)/HNH endonuclease
MCSTAGDPEQVPLERLEREITALAAHINAATATWLGLVAELDRREGWAEWGCRSCVHWLSYRCGLSPSAGREQVRVARQLGDLPELRAAFERGELCYSQVRAVTRVATPETEHGLVEIARHATAAQLETIVRAFRGVLEVELGDDDERHRRRYVRCEHDDQGALLIHARLPAEEGALVVTALEAGRDALRGDASAEATQIGDDVERFTPSNADSLVLLAQTALAHGPAVRSGGEHQVVVHVDVASLAHREGAPPSQGELRLEGGPALHPETARRLGCDAALVRVLERDGRPLSVGRRTRAVPPALRRALQSRDECCRFPGCDQRRFLHAHHIHHWAHGGRTDLSNLVHLCSHHHRLLHEGGYTVERRSGHGLLFRRPDGRAVPAAPARPHGRAQALVSQHRQDGLEIGQATCVPRVERERMQLHWIVDGLAEADARLYSLAGAA